MALSAAFRLSIHLRDLPLKHPFTISRSTITTQPTVIVELSDGIHSGFGEATTNDYYGMTSQRIVAAIESVRDEIESMPYLNPSELWARLHDKLPDEPFGLCAIDQAAYDLWGKQLSTPVHQLWELDINHLPVSNFTIGIDTLENMIHKLQEVPDWPVYKIKLGTADDLKIITELRQHTTATFRVDANCGWTVDETLVNARQLRELGVEFIEQPLPAEDLDGSARVYQHSVLPIMADESCITERDVKSCKDRFHGVNIKLVKCGGLTPARRMIQQARELGLKVMVGCMTESTVGISAIAQLLPLLDFVDMDGAELLAEDIASGVRVERGSCHYSPLPGSGVALLPPT
ncbi:MAG: dipeptide epimerase [Rubripirellula sp.]|nr:dipeptide epimerase [Rhodopirellula sp.]MCH1438865.1 dipeptide epimerase [Rubripirellula sp.]OUX07484.1 MAG: dipeptide epimerase [Planctomycetaceae bacterium TMED240]